MRRIESVDVLRLFAVTAVIAIHARPFYTSSSTLEKLFSLLIDQGGRFAVPFFFVISGYFWGVKSRSGVALSALSSVMAQRLFAIFVAWSVIYVLPYDLSTMWTQGVATALQMAGENVRQLALDPLTLLMQGTKVHLWFLMALLCSLGISHFFVRRKLYKTLIVVSIALYVFGLLAKAYADTPIGWHIHFNTRNGPFFGTLFFVSGYFLSYLNPRTEWFAWGLAFLGLGTIIHFAEIFLLWKIYGTSPYQDYVIGTYFMGMGAALAALSNTRLLRNVTLSKLGKYTLGIYAVQFIFLDNLQGVTDLVRNTFWAVPYILLVLLLSVAAAVALSRNRFTRHIVV